MIPYHIISYHIVPYHIISYYITSYHIIPYHNINSIMLRKSAAGRGRYYLPGDVAHGVSRIESFARGDSVIQRFPI